MPDLASGGGCAQPLCFGRGLVGRPVGIAGRDRPALRLAPEGGASRQPRIDSPAVLVALTRLEPILVNRRSGSLP